MGDWESVFEAAVKLAWPILVGALLFIYRELLTSRLQAGGARVQRGDEIEIGTLTIGKAVGQLKLPVAGQILTDDHFALIRRS
jgi:hypothetical protein